MGNSQGVVLPKPVLAQIGATDGTKLTLVVEGGAITLTPVKPHPRAGWAESMKALAESGDDGIDDEWLAFGNEFDRTEPEW
jgi:antitoxin MazE